MGIDRFSFQGVLKPGKVWGVLLLCMANLAVMHYTILVTCPPETTNVFFYLSNAFSMVFDVVVLFLFFYVLTWKRLKPTLWLCFFTTLLWSLCNVLYARFFHHYLTISAIGQAGTLMNGWMLRCVVYGLRWTDLCYVLMAVAGAALLLRTSPGGKPRHLVRNLLWTIAVYLLVNFVAYGVYSYVKHPQNFLSYFEAILKYRITRTPRSPIYSHFLRGEVRSLCVDAWLSAQGTMKLSASQRKEVEKAVAESRFAIADSLANVSPRNVIFIIVESYMALTSDLKVDGKEVTPCLNALKHGPDCYFNGKMRENVSMGESSDGQFIYMTGLFPFISNLTVSKAGNCTLPGLPKSLGRRSRMVIPTVSSVWEQDAMCRSYGFDRLYSIADYDEADGEFLNDGQLFRMSSMLDGQTGSEPFFSVMITMSMHEPYTEWIDPSFKISDPSLGRELACYLNACHYTDRQIGAYIERLKKAGLYDNSLIVITADHAAHALGLSRKDSYLPLYIIARNLPEMHQGKCNQIDVYPTLLDLLGIKQEWNGMGKSLLRDDYDSRITRKKWELSEWIVLSDYFGK